MHLVYLDESGNTGTDLENANQPIFVLGALIVPEGVWGAVTGALEAAVKRHFPDLASDGVEIHGSELRSGRTHFKGVPVSARLALRDDWLRIANDSGLKFVFRAIEKARFQKWAISSLGTGITINPHVAAFALVARVVDAYLQGLSDATLGMFISDENKEVVHDVEKSISALRVMEGPLQLVRIIEKGFFIDSSKSRVLQLCDVCTLAARKLEEVKIGRESKSIDESARELLAPLIHFGNESLNDVIKWLVEQRRNSQ
ncbi:MAG: DUF3800 domain-containing protein [Planctomycetia bacterium]|nr:DUF3800 domain-containing protein [Planctomycetia bacterium]